MLYVLLCVALCPFKYCNHLDEEERAGCFAWFVFLVSRGGWAALPRGAMGCLRFVIVVFPDHTHLLFLCLLCLCTRLFICVLWSPAGKGLTSWL